MPERILVLDNQETVRQLLERQLAGETRIVSSEALPADLPGRIAAVGPSLLILDPAGADGDAAQILAGIRKEWPALPVIILSSQPEIRQAVAAMRAGAFDYLPKPVPLRELLASVERSLELYGGEHEVLEQRRLFKMGSEQGFYKSRGDAMARVYNTALMVAMSENTSTLIQGESGTGKEIIAQLIHKLSPRRLAPYMELNCAAIPSELLESELFGHEAGAFTDAKETKAGLFEVADKGSFLLDEIGEMSLNLQVKLLRFLERRMFRRVGGTKDISVDLRIISSTNRDLREMVKEGSFREDLYYRLNVVPVKIPPLRERRDDIIPLICYFLDDYNSRFNKNFVRIDEAARRALMDYPWPGNIRELKNVVERVVLMESGPVMTVEQLRPLLGGSWDEVRETFPKRLQRVLEEPIPEEGLPLEDLIGDLERKLIEKAYTQFDGNQSRAAEMLGLGRDKLRYRMKQIEAEVKADVENCS